MGKVVFRLVLASLAAAMLASCEQKVVPTEQAVGPLYVYSSYDDVDYLPALFRLFTEETGIHVVVRHRSDAENLRDMRDKSGSQPADILLTSSIWAAWLAADDGLLRPLEREPAVHQVPEFLRDVDGLWVGLSIDPIVITGPTNRFTDMQGFSYAALGDSPFAEQLCLTSSEFSENRVLIAMMMDAMGDREAELTVRKWMRNLALPPREKISDLGLSDAASPCNYAITRLSALQSSNQAVLRHKSPLFFDVEAMGIGRHAEHPEAAQQLIDWLLSAAINAKHARQQHVLPLNFAEQTRLPEVALASQHIGVAGFRYREAEQLAERARYP